MRISKFLIFFSAAIFLSLSSILYPNIKIHKSLSTEDGLVSNRIFCMFQDSKGYIWFGTDNGVSRWDGKNFKNYYKKDGLASSQVMDIKEGPNGIIYFATYGKGITYLKNDSLFTYNTKNGLSSDWMVEILVRNNGDIIFVGESGAISILQNNVLEKWLDLPILKNNSIWAIYEENDSTLYFGTHVLVKYQNGTIEVFEHDDTYNPSFSQKVIYSIEKDLYGNLFVGTLNGIYQLTTSGLQKIVVNGTSSSHAAIHIKTAKDGSVYACSENGVLIKKQDRYELLTKENGLSDNSIWSVLQDKNVKSPDGSRKIEVVEHLEGGGYTFIRGTENGEEIWIAVRSMPVEEGDVYYFTEAMEMSNFESKSLNKTFESILFVDKVSKTPISGGNPAGHSSMPPMMGSDGHSKPAIKAEANIEIAPLSDGYTVEAVNKDRAKLAGKTIKVKGQVTKYNGGIMKRNWIHIQDGTGTGATADLTVTSDQSAKVGDVIIIEGTVTVDKDFGSGYFYEVIVENAKITIDKKS